MINDRPAFAIHRVCQFTHKSMGVMPVTTLTVARRTKTITVIENENRSATECVVHKWLMDPFDCFCNDIYLGRKRTENYTTVVHHVDLQRTLGADHG